MILVVDDDIDVRETLCEVLADEGFRVGAARNGVEALAILRQGAHVCLIFLDLMMPVMSGYEFLRERSAHPELAQLPVVVMSARWEGSEETAIPEFVRKPLALAAILAFAERYCADERHA